MIQPATWDTEHFGLKVGELLWTGDFDNQQLEAWKTRSKKEGYDVLYLRGVELPEDALDEDVVLADQKTVYAMTIDHHRPSNRDNNVVSLLHRDLSPELLELAYESGKFSRYRTDKRFPNHVFPTLYRIWIMDSLRGLIATDVLAYMDKDAPIGIITYKQEGWHVTIGLVAVHPAWAGRGIGTRLMQSFLSLFEPGTQIDVATQACNRGACHFYEKNGFAIKSVTNIYHIWNTPRSSISKQ